MNRFLFILLTIVTCTLASCSKVGDIFIVPKSFHGAVYVIYTQKKGIIGHLENGNRVFSVPNDGIVKTQLPPDNSWRKFPGVFYIEDGRRIEVPFIIDDSLSPIRHACCLISGSAYKKINGHPTLYDMFYIGTDSSITQAEVKQRRFNIADYVEEVK